MKWLVWDSGAASAAENMRLDELLLLSLPDKPECVLHFYSWARASATFGYFIDPSKYLDLTRARQQGIELARRPTGGGIVFHTTDLAFSVLIPNQHPRFSCCTLANYALVNHAVREAIFSFTGRQAQPELFQASNAPTTSDFCMAKPTKYDVMLDGRKVGGAAQRRTKHGLLHQGTISLALPDFQELEQLFLPGVHVVEDMRRHSCALLGNVEGLAVARENMKAHLEAAVLEV